jgi:hypothetical protein
MGVLGMMSPASDHHHPAIKKFLNGCADPGIVDAGS